MIKIIEAKTPIEKILLYTSFVIFLIIAAWAAFFVPMNNDEVNHYRLLGWMAHPFSIYAYQGDGSFFDLTTVFGFKMHRAFSYAGGICSSFLYSPFYFLFHDAIAQYVYSAVWFILFAVAIARLMTRPLVAFVLILSFFPFIFNFLHDLGPIKLAFTAFPVGAWLYRKAWAASMPLAAIYAVLIVLILGVCIEDKILFVLLLPAFFFFCLAFHPEAEWKTLSTKRFFLLWGLVGSITLLILTLFLSSQFQNGQYYLTFLIEADHARTTIDSHNELMLELSKNYLTGSTKWFGFILFWPYYAHRYFDFGLGDGNKNFILFCSFSVFSGLWLCSCLGTSYLMSRKKTRLPIWSGRGLWLMASFGAMVVAYLAIGGTWGAHHFVFLWLPLLLLMAHVLSHLNDKKILGLVVSFMFLNLICLFVTAQQRLLYEVSPERQEVMDFFAENNRSEQAVVAYLDWGNHYIQELYGPRNQLVTVMKTRESFGAIYDLSQQLNRQMYIVCRTRYDAVWEQLVLGDRCTKRTLEIGAQKLMGTPFTFTDVLPDLQVWHVFSVTPG